MNTVRTVRELRAAVARARGEGKRIGFVPTMGNLHDGHAALVEKAAQRVDFVVASIFVNPLQFGANEDLASYPRTLEADQERLLDRIRQALGPGGLFITRVGDAQGGMPFRISQFVDRFASFMQGHRLTQMWCRPVMQWVQALENRGFVVKTLPMNEGTPFANVLLTARLP